MGSRRVQIIFLLAYLVIHSSIAEKCKPSTCFSNNKSPIYNPKSGQQYIYDFESTATAQLVNKESVETSLAIRGQAVITVGANCGYTLTLQNVFASGADNAKQVIKDFMTHPVQFTLSGDELLTEICADEKDGIFSLNVKRGIISALQNSVGRNIETDIFGRCPVTSSQSSSGGITTVTRSRDLDNCAYREKFVNGLMQGVVTESSAIKTTPLVNGKVTSEAKFQNDVLQSTEIKETYSYLPFSTQNHGAKAKVTTKLNLKKTATGTANAPKNGVQRTVLFVNTNENLASTKVKESIKSAFDKALKEFTGHDGTIASTAATAFADLIRLMRLAKKNDLTVSYQSMKTNGLSNRQSGNKALSRALFLDALFRTGTGDSVSALVDLSKKELDDKEKHLMYLSFNTVTSVTKEAITSLIKLFTENLPKEAYLSIGSIVSKYCRERGCEQGDIKQIAEKFIAKIPKDCITKNKKDEEQLVSVLKGIRNSQTILNTAVNNIIACANSQRSSRVRVAALQAMTANPCSKKLQQTAIQVMKSRDDDSEVRIEAYLAAVECPNGALANEIQAMLDSETINQVGSFVSTHINSIRASTDPKREAARYQFKNLRTSKKFPFDPRRYSFNREVSYAIDSLGLGSAVDTSVIYSQRSFLPRSVRVNVTGSLFGNSFNFFELSARQENFETIVERYFGPRGFFNRLSKQELYDALLNEFSSLDRSKRALPQDMAQFDKSVKLSNEFNRDPDIDLSMKVFGTELYFLSMSQNMPATPSDFIQFLVKEMQKGVDALKDFNYNFENHALWLDSEIVYPTALGLPFKLVATGASAVKIDLSGSIDVKKILENPLDSKVEINFSPAANIFVAGTLGFSSYAYETGLEVSGTVYTNSGSNTTVEWQGGQSLTIKSIPTLKNQYVLEMKHQISTVSQETGREAVKVPVNFKGLDHETSLCFDQLEFLTGASYCFEMQSTPQGKADEHALWPLYGTSSFAMRLEMVDSITFRTELDINDTPSITFYHDTPNGGKPRQTTLKLLSSIKPTHYSVGFELTAPIMTGPFEISAKVGFVNEENLKKLYGQGGYQKQKYDYEVGFKKQGNEILPILKLNTDMSYVSGKIIESKTPRGVSYALQTIKFGRDDYQTTIDGSISAEGPKLVSKLKFDVGGKKVDLDGSLGYNKGHFDTDVTLKSDNIPSANGKFEYDVKYAEKSFGNDLTLVWGKDLSSKQNRIEWSQMADWSDENCKFKNEITLGYIDAGAKFNGEFGKKVLNLDASGNYKTSNAELKLDNKYSQKQPHDYETSFYAASNKKSIKIDMSRDIEGESSRVKNKLELSTGLKVEINGKISHKIMYNDCDVALQGTFIPGPKREVTKVTYMVKNTQKGHDGSWKVLVGRNELATGDSKLTYGQDIKGTMKMNVKDTVNVDGTYESKKGKGNIVFNVGLKDRKLHTATQFTIQKPVYDFASDFYYDYEKDNSKKITFSTKNKIQPRSIDSKNILDVFNERYALNFGGSVEGDTIPGGHQKLNFDLQLPTGRKVSTDFDRDFSGLKNGKGNGKVNWKFTDELPNRQQRHGVIDLTINNIDMQNRYFDMVESFKYKDYDNKDYKLQFSIKNLAKGHHFATASATIQSDGALMTHPLTANIKIDEYCKEHAIYSFNSKYGDIGDINVSGKFYTANNERPYSHDFTGKLNVPKSQFKTITVTSSGKISEPVNADGVYTVVYSGSVDYTGNKFELDTELNFSKTKGTGSVNFQLPNQKPFGGDFKFNCNHKDTADSQLTLTYGDNKKISTTLKAQMPDERNIQLGATLSGDLQMLKEISININANRPQDNYIQVKVNGKYDNQAYAMDFEQRASADDPKLLITFTCPKGHKSKILAEAQIVSSLKGKGSLVIEKLYNFDLTANVDGDLTSMENFYVKGDVDCPTLKMNKYEFDVHSKDAGGRKGIEYKVTREGKHVISGSTDYTMKTDKGKTIIEGKSTVKLTEGKSDDVTFKLIRNVYERSRDGEVGFGGMVTVTMGPRNYASDIKITDKEFHMKYSGCAKKNSCTNFEAKSYLEQSDVSAFKHNLELTVDLRQAGFPHEFGLKSETSRENFKLSHTMDAYLQTKDKPEYQYSVFINPKEAGASLSMPKREIALDASYKYPKTFYGVYESTLTFFIDKRNKPQMKSEVGFRGEIKHAGTSQLTGKGDLTFTHPKVKPLRVGGEFEVNTDNMHGKSKIEFDIFTKPLDMIVITSKFGNDDTTGQGFNLTSTCEIYSKGLGFNYKKQEYLGLSLARKEFTYGYELILPVDDFKFSLNAFASTKNLELSAVAFNEEFLKTTGQYDPETHNINMEGSFRYLKSEPFVSKASIKGLSEGSFTLTKGQLLNVDGGYGLGKYLHMLVKGSGKEVFNGKVALDTAHFLKTTYKVDEQQVKALTTAVQDQIKKDIETAKNDVTEKFEKVKKYRTDKIDAAEKALPDFRQFNQEYSKDIQALLKELQEDQNVMKLMEIVTPVLAELSKYFEELVNIFGEQYEVLEEFCKKICNEISIAFNERILPELKAFYNSLQVFLEELISQGTKMVTAVFERASKALKTFEEDFNKISQAFKDITGGIFESITLYVNGIIEEVKAIYQNVRETLNSLPGLDALRKKYEEYFSSFSPIQAVAAVIEEVLSTIMDLMPDNAKPFFNKLNSYIRNKIEGSDVNDMEILKEIYGLFMEALQALKKEYLDTVNSSSSVLPFSLDALKRLPPLFTNVRFSVISQLASDPIVSLKDVLYLYRPYAFNPMEAIPPFTMHGEIADGSHIFTFDGRHITFPGECTYILARDFVEGNFSIVASMKNGKMKSITVHDKTGFVEVNADGNIKYRDRDSDFPIHDKTIHAWRDYFTFGLLTTFGAQVECSMDLTICHVQISGFYAGRTRGLMGNGNGEPYDDYTMPDGKIVDSTNDFGNAYKSQKSCAAVTKSMDGHQKSHTNEFCAEYFGRDSSVRLCSLFVDPTNYQEACEHATHGAANPQTEACKIVSVYASRCRKEMIPVTIPKGCNQCTVEPQKVDIGDEVSIKVPQKQADIIVVFDTAIEKDLTVATEIMNEVRRELKVQGITDVNVAAIGYHANDRYTSLYTTKGKLDFKGKFETLKGTGVPEDEVVKTRNVELDNVVSEVEKMNKQTKQDYNLSPDARAFRKALAYPFRPTATKTILAIRSDGIPYSINPAKLTAGQLSIELTTKAGIAVHAIMPVKITEPSDKIKNIVGFNSNVALLINEKKRPNMGSVDVNNKLKYEQDMGVDLTRQRGYVFNLNNYATDKKKFVGVAGYVLADSIARTEVVSECKCYFRNGIYPNVGCISKSTQLLAPKKAAARG